LQENTLDTDSSDNLFVINKPLKTDIISGTPDGTNPTNGDVISNIENNINTLNTRTGGLSQVKGRIPVGQYFQYPFQYFYGFAALRLWESYFEVYKIFTIMTGNKYAGEITELKSFEYKGNGNVNFTIEIVDGAGDDISKYIRVTNTGSIELPYDFGMINLI
jgi:hypothetical protein